MAAFTRPDGLKVQIKATDVIRARRVIYGETKNKDVKSRIDWGQMQLVMEPIEEVSSRIKTELEAAKKHVFMCLHSRDGTPIWFNATKAVGPMPLIPMRQDGVVHSAIKLMGYRQYVTETPEQVRKLLKEYGGTIFVPGN